MTKQQDSTTTESKCECAHFSRLLTSNLLAQTNLNNLFGILVDQSNIGTTVFKHSIALIQLVYYSVTGSPLSFTHVSVNQAIWFQMVNHSSQPMFDDPGSIQNTFR